MSRGKAGREQLRIIERIRAKKVAVLFCHKSDNWPVPLCVTTAAALRLLGGGATAGVMNNRKPLSCEEAGGK